MKTGAVTLWITTLLASAACFTIPALAASDYQPPLEVERFSQQFDLHADGTYDYAEDNRIRVLTAQGVEIAATREISYIAEEESIDSIEAWTELPDGTRLDVSQDSIRDRDEDNREATSFNDTRYKVIIFPRVEVGAVIAYRVRSRVTVAAYPGHFQTSLMFSSARRWREAEVRFSAPEGKVVFYESRGVDGGLERVADGRSYYRFRYRSDQVKPLEDTSINRFDREPRLLLSTLKDMEALGQVASEFFADRVSPTPEIRALARRLTADRQTTSEQTRALYEWVARNVKYVSVALGRGRLVPHAAGEVYARRYGDCKDHVVLLAALLAAVGIESSPVLVNSGDSFSFGAIGTHGAINHVITYIPSLSLFLDATSPFTPYGSLPLSVTDKPVLILNEGRVARTPPLRPVDNAIQVEAELLVQGDGTVHGRATTRMTGPAEEASRSRRHYHFGTEEERVRELLARFNETGSGSLSSPDPLDLAAPWSVSSMFNLDPVVPMPGRGGFAVPVGLTNGRLAAMAQDRPLARYHHASVCRSEFVEETYRMRFPEGVDIEEVPAGNRYEKDGVSYESHFERSGRSVYLKRRLQVSREGSVCGPAQAAGWAAFHAVLVRDLRSQIVFRPAGGR